SIMKMLERKKTGQVAEESGRTPVSAVFKYRNVVVSIFICCLYIAWMMVFASFCTMYLSRARGFDVATAGFILSAWGFGGFIGMIAIPALSDYFGRKPTMIVASIFAGLSVLVFVFSGFGPVGLFISLLVCGIFGWGAFPIFLSIFPSESVPPDVMATATSLPPSIGEVFGSIAMPTIAGLLADMYGLEYPMYLAGVAPILAAFVSLFYLETAPRIITKRSETTNKSM
ncbi:MAG: hypothetical protein PWQ96_1902, partial [Clostridia bacterium]|nr:hypothetical protein [Clostridia bacterium]